MKVQQEDQQTPAEARQTRTSEEWQREGCATPSLYLGGSSVFSAAKTGDIVVTA